MTGSLDDATTTVKHYYDDDSDIELTQSYCANNGYRCSVDSQSITTNYTYSDTSDYTVTVEWEGRNINNGAFRQSQHEGDHVHVCTTASGAIKLELKVRGRTKYITVRGKQSVISIDINYYCLFFHYSS